MDLRPRVLLGQLGSLADRIDPDGRQDQPATDTDTTPDGTDTAPDSVPDSTDTTPDKPQHAPATNRLPDWWRAKPDILTKEPAPEPAPAAEPSDIPEPAPDDGPEDDEPEQKEEGEGDEDTREGVSARVRHLWRERFPDAPEKEYSRPTYRPTRAPKQALLDAWWGMSAKTRHLAYNGAALGIGWYLGVPQFFTAETAYLAHTYDSWAHPYVVVWYGVAVAVWLLDHRTRSWLPFFALLARVPLVSMVIGVALYGTTTIPT